MKDEIPKTATSASIIICTCNRSSSLIDTLQSIVNMAVPENLVWEVIVVDNNSTDRTRQKVNEFINMGHRQIKYLFEPRQGKAYALNLAVSEARGDVLVFTDDDALVDEHWLARIIDTFHRYDADCVGGKVIPLWLSKRPDWLNNDLLNVLAMLDFGDTILEIDARSDRMLYGVNYAFKKTFFEQNGLFNTDLCSRGAGNEDHDLFQRLKKQGGRAIYHPGVLVHHKVFPERMTKRYFRKWHYLVGIDRSHIATPARLRLLGIESYMIRNFLSVAVKSILVVRNLDSAALFRTQLTMILYLSFFKARIKQCVNGRFPLLCRY